MGRREGEKVDIVPLPSFFTCTLSLYIYLYLWLTRWRSQELMAIGIALGNAWGLFVLVFLLGIGLVELPRSLYYKSHRELTLNYHHFRYRADRQICRRYRYKYSKQQSRLRVEGSLVFPSVLMGLQSSELSQATGGSQSGAHRRAEGILTVPVPVSLPCTCTCACTCTCTGRSAYFML